MLRWVDAAVPDLNNAIPTDGTNHPAGPTNATCPTCRGDLQIYEHGRPADKLPLFPQRFAMPATSIRRDSVVSSLLQRLPSLDGNDGEQYDEVLILYQNLLY